jgi:hypothetical protein
MNDTVRIERPLVCRRHQDLGGRAKQDSQGNSVKVRTRADDCGDDFDDPVLEHTVKMDKR